MLRAATPSPAAAQIVGQRARPNATGAAAVTDHTAGVAGAGVRARCLPRRARAAATRHRCHSNPAATSPCIAQRASSSAAAEPAAAAGTARAAPAAEGATNVHVEPRDGESFDQFLRRFKTSMDKSGILREYKRKRYFKSNGELQREKAKAAARRRTKRFRGPRPLRPAR